MTQDTGRKIAGGTLIGLGGLFLLAQVTGFDFFGLAWPLFVLIPGGIFLMLALSGNDDAIGLIFPGVIITGTGLILTYQNMTDHWESWAYIWTLYPVFVGMGLRYMGSRTDDADTIKVGRMMLIGGLAGFVVLGGVFELFIFNGAGMGMLTVLIPLGMIGAGTFMLLRGTNTRKSKRKAHDSHYAAILSTIDE